MPLIVDPSARVVPAPAAPGRPGAAGEVVMVNAQATTLSVGGVPVTAGASRIRIPPVAPSLEVFAPAPYQVIQRRAGNVATIAISGAYTGRNRTIQARWGDGAWVTIATPTDGSFSGELPDQPVGQRTLSVRLAGDADSLVEVPFVGIGDVFGLWGQSNGSGRGTAYQSYSHPTLKATMLANDNVWKDLTDPTDIATGQVDSISYDGPLDAAGSVWPLVATAYMAAKGFPVAFVPCCRGGQGNVRWQPQPDHFNRGTLYGSALYRCATLAGGVKAVLYWAGEPGVDAPVTDYTAYQPVALAVRDDLGVPVMRCALQYCTGGTAAEAAGVYGAVQYIWANPSDFNAVTGPDLHDIVSDDGFHLMSTEKVADAAARWATAMLAAF